MDMFGCDGLVFITRMFEFGRMVDITRIFECGGLLAMVKPDISLILPPPPCPIHYKWR